MVYRQLDDNTGELKFYGNISQWWISGEDFTRTIEEMASKFKTIHVRVHCYGGTVFEGNVMVNALRRCKAIKKFYIDGVAASMMTIVMQEADEIICAENGYVMVHSPCGYQEGSARKMMQAHKLLTSMEKTFAKVYARRTGKSEKDVQAWFDDSDHWFSAEESLEEGLITSIEAPVAADAVKLEKPTDNNQAEAMFNAFTALAITDPQNNDTTQIENCNMKKELIAKFNLTGVTENSTDAEITAAIQAKMDASSTENKTTKTEAIEAIIKAAETATGKTYEATVRATLATVGEASGLAALQTMLGINAPSVAASAAADGGTKVPTVINLMNNSGGVADDRSTWSWDKWQAEDPDGVEKMQKEQPDQFKALYKAKFGVDVSL